jgi:hypothetical protein
LGKMKFDALGDAVSACAYRGSNHRFARPLDRRGASEGPADRLGQGLRAVNAAAPPSSVMNSRRLIPEAHI